MPPGWQATRARILNRDGHRCQQCGSYPAAIVDHVDRTGPEDDANLQALCQACSDAKTRAEADQAAATLGARSGYWHR
jgi:5-methylcytosine-specific restriction endonuclease McrA